MLGPADIRGLYPATPVPFYERTRIDREGLSRVLSTTFGTDGVSGIAVNGHVGEILTLSPEERGTVVAAAVEARGEGQIVIGGVEGHTPDAVIEQARVAEENGADALLVFPPTDVHTYRKLARYPEIVVEFFTQVGRGTSLPFVIFQYPDATNCAFSNDSLRALSELDQVIAVKASCGTVTRYVEIAEALGDRAAALAAVDSPPLLGMLMHGAPGALIGVSSVLPLVWSRLIQSVNDGRLRDAQVIHRDACIPLMDAIFQHHQARDHVSEAGTIKEALRQQGVIASSAVRFPAQAVTAERADQIAEAMSRASKTLDELGLAGAA